MMLQQIVRFIRAGNRFAVVSHARPDGDSIGCSVAVGLALEQIGKRVSVVHRDPPPHAYRALPGIGKIQVADRLDGQYDGVIMLECNSLERSGVAGLQHHPIVNIDHHKDAARYGLIDWIDPSAAALGEMIHLLVPALGASVTPEIAANLYAAILTDTGSFQFSNTTGRTFTVAAELVACGADPGAVAQDVYLSQPLSKVRLLGKVLDTLQIHPSGSIATISMTQRMVREAEASPDDTEGIVTHALSVDGVMMVAFLCERPNGGVRVSLRSKPGYDISPIARRHGGGGHANAAGLTMEGGLEDVRTALVAELEGLLA